MIKVEIENIKLMPFHCEECDAFLGKFKLIRGEIVIEIKCRRCNFYNTIYLKKK